MIVGSIGFETLRNWTFDYDMSQLLPREIKKYIFGISVDIKWH